MQKLSKAILHHARNQAEGVPVSAKGLLHLGSRAAVDQTLSRLARCGDLLRVGRGLYVLPVKYRFGSRAPSVLKTVEALAAQRGERIASSSAMAANAFGLTTQVPVKPVFLTSGRSRKLKLGHQEVELRHAPPWQLVLGGRKAGDAVRALAWLGPEESRDGAREDRAIAECRRAWGVGRRQRADAGMAGWAGEQAGAWLSATWNSHTAIVGKCSTSPPTRLEGRRIFWKRTSGSSGFSRRSLERP